MGWVEPHNLTPAATDLINAKGAVLLATTADEAFARLADSVQALQQRQARNPLTLDVVVSRLKTELDAGTPAVSAHDSVAEEFARLRHHAAFAVENYDETSTATARVSQVEEAVRIPAAIAAVLSYWGRPEHDRWWIPELQRLTRPVVARSSPMTTLTVVAASKLFYAAGVAAVAAENYDLLRRLFELDGPYENGSAQPLLALLDPVAVAELNPTEHHESVAKILTAALRLDPEVIDDAWQLFDILRAALHVMGAADFDSLLGRYQAAQRSADALTAPGQPPAAHAVTEQRTVLDTLMARCRVRGHHILGADRVYEPGDRRWASPVAESLIVQLNRGGDRHPLAQLTTGRNPALTLALTAVSRAVGTAAEQIAATETQCGVVPMQAWLDQTAAAA